MKLFDKLGRLLLHISQDAEITYEGDTKLRVKDDVLNKTLEQLLLESQLHSELLDKRIQDVRLIDSDGVSFGLRQTLNEPHVVSISEGIEIAREDIPGKTAIHILGNNNVSDI